MNSNPSIKLDTLFTPGLVAAQQPTWPGGPEGPQVKAAVAELKALPPLVFAGECDDLKARIAMPVNKRTLNKLRPMAKPCIACA